jgi:hypothetical protein
LARCAAIKPDGERCKVDAMPAAEWCYSHHPDYAEERRRRASKAGKSGGRGRPATELKDVKALCEDLTEQVLAGALPPGPAAVANQLINTRLRAIEQERKIRETEDLEARIEVLERTSGDQKGARKWGA